jgi:spermidine synthase
LARAPQPTGGTWPVRFGTAELVRDLDRPSGWMLLVDGTPQSYVDLDDPTYLDFDYVRLLADLVDALPPGPVTAVHLGGAGCTLPRYVAATRPGSTQVVVEADEPLAQVVRAQLGTAGFRLRVGDAREALGQLTRGASDVVVSDVFTGSVVPTHLATLETVQEVAALLRPGGLYAMNIADSGALPFARRQAAALAEVFAHVVVLADPGVLRGRRFGNLVLAGSDTAFDLDPRRRARDGRELAAGARPATDAEPATVPVPPAALFGA